jgi:hypothetical protein
MVRGNAHKRVVLYRIAHVKLTAWAWEQGISYRIALTCARPYGCRSASWRAAAALVAIGNVAEEAP